MSSGLDSSEPPISVALGGNSGAKRVRSGVSISVKAIVLFVAVALIPVTFVSLWLTSLYRAAVETSEKQLQTSALAELAGAALKGIGDVQADAEAMAGVLSVAVNQPGEETSAFAAVKALLASRRSIRAVRLEVPAAGVSTVIRHASDMSTVEPESTAELRAIADERRVAFQLIGPNAGIVVVPVPAAPDKRTKGYVSARVDLSAFAERLQQVAETRFDTKSVHILVADQNRKLVAGYDLQDVAPGSDTRDLPIWKTLPAGNPWLGQVAIVSEHRQAGVAMVGAVQTVPQLAWTLAMWRPKHIAYANLWRLTQRYQIGAGISVLVALMIGLVAARRIVMPIKRLSKQARLIGERRWHEVSIEVSRGDELGDLNRSLVQMARALEHGEQQIQKETRLRSDLSRFMSRELVDAIVAGEHSLELGGKRAEITVLFADIVAFTPLAESRPPEVVVTLLNELFGMLSEIVFRHGGTVDKFIGDCIMAVWGVPVSQADHGTRALGAAEEMLRFLEVANEDWARRYDVQLRLAIGVNSGAAIVGNIGSNKRMEYTVVGDVVNVAARLEAIAKPNQILVAHDTRYLVSHGFSFISHGEHRLTGREAKTEVYELVVT